MDFDFYTKEEINAMLGGLSFIKISKADFDEITTKDPNTIYYVYDESNVTQYIGDAKLSSGATAGDAIPYLLNPALVGFVGNATTVPEQ